MENHRHSMTPAAASLILLLSSAAATGLAQAPTPSPGKMPQHQTGMKDMPRMSGVKETPHHVLAMAYRDNLVTFAKALQGQVRQSKTVNLDLARPAVVEMRRSFDRMQQHHQAQMTMMGDKMMGDRMMGGRMPGDQTKPLMSETMQGTESHLTALSEHLSALEAAVNAGTPDPKTVLEHTTEILKQCAKMSALPGMAKPHQMK